MNLERFNYYVEGRAFEWVMAASMFFAGMELALWPGTLSFGAFQWLLEVMSQPQIGTFMIMVGWLRMCGLMLNGQTIGNKKIGPYVRAFCGVLAGSLWVQFALALLQLSIRQGFPSIGLPFWTMFTVAELYVAYTTVKNA